MSTAQAPVAPAESLPTLLIVDDDAVLRERLSRAFERRGFAVTMAVDGTAAIQLAESDSPEYALVDMRMPGPSGLDVVRELVRIDPDTRIVVLTAYGSIATAIEAIYSPARSSSSSSPPASSRHRAGSSALWDAHRHRLDWLMPLASRRIPPGSLQLLRPSPTGRDFGHTL